MKKILIFLTMLFFSLQPLFSQKVVSGISDTKFISITRDPLSSQTPYLEIINNSMLFKDSDNDNKIDASENDTIRFELKNTGIGSGKGLAVQVTEINGIAGLEFPKEILLGNLEPNKVIQVNIPVKGALGLVNSKANFSFKINEASGFGTDPIEMEILTQAFQAPKLTVVDFKVSSQQSANLMKKKPFDLEILLQNTGQGVATETDAKLIVPMNVYCLSGNEVYQKKTLAPGEQVMISYSLVATNDYNAKTLPFSVKLNEKFGKYAEDKAIMLTMNQAVSGNKLILEAINDQPVNIKIGSLSSSVDKNIPMIGKKNSNRYALIVGNEVYSNNLNAEVNVEFASNDAQMFRDYAISTMGVTDQNIFFLTNATAGAMRREIERVSEIVKRIGSKAELIFYYAGHGYPDESTQTPYLIPVDVDATNLQSAIKLSEVYAKFGETGAKSITVFLDACFSGGGRNQGLLAARGVKIKPKSESVRGNMVVFAATSGVQVALPYKEQQHGMFTYFLLKNMQETNGQFTLGELADYLKQNVGIESLRTNSKSQDPEVQVSPSVEDSWRNWTFR
jgi:hypothetical protein